ncbi:transglycosylase domain-containing protein [Chryseolinea sp. H1M3-3]|uniref:transglycosylase domain-containing protein n=1 Tax=Chryseolinea sp. H1M3-3 TaxID=3034144 RepID=UPI0023EC995E|nr:transglycosylase domain-containing protein [Chryseolinea sp. H1M3-3]
MKELFNIVIAKLKSNVRDFNNKPGIFRRIVWYFGLLSLCIFSSVVAFILMIWMGVFGEIPSKKELSSINHQVATEIFSADSVLLGRYYWQERSTVPANEITTELKNALVATEDVRFYNHHGIDTRSMFRVLIKSILLQNESAGGGSTITQQLAKNLFPRQSFAVLSLPINKIKEMIIARRLENTYTKDEILVLYLNTVPFGDNVYGVKTAADRFFSSSVKNLTVDQAAVLIGMLKATHAYNPRVYPDRAKQRRNVVLAQMHKYDFISSDEKNTLQKKPLGLRYNKITHNSGLAPYFREYIKKDLEAWCASHERPDGKPYNLYTDGLKVYTTIDSRLQRYSEVAMQSHMKELQKKFIKQMSKKTLDEVVNGHLKKLTQYKAWKEQGLSEKEILAEMKKPAFRKIFTWEGGKELEISVYDSLLHHLQFLQAGLLAIEPQTGHVKAWVGGIDHEFFQYDHIRESTKRQIGSTFKPIVYAAALERGVDPCEYVSARQTSYSNMEDWTPQNSSNDSYDKKYSMEGGLAGSVNTVSVKMLEKAGIGQTIAMANKMGIKSDLPNVPSIALGSPSISMIEMVSAYGVFANKGNYVKPVTITSILDGKGNVLEEIEVAPKRERALSEATADMMIHMLKRVVNEGTGSSLRGRYGLTNDIAGKTGTTQSNADGWFIGITPHLVIGAWVGADDPRMHFRSTSQGQGSATALPIVAKLLQHANKDQNLKYFTRARFSPIAPELLERLSCDLERSDKNFFQRLFNIKRKVKERKFKSGN